MRKLKPLLTVLLLVLSAALVACAGPEPAPSDDILAPLPTTAGGGGNGVTEADATLPTLFDLLSADPNLIFFTNGLSSVGLADEMQSGGPFTVFAASNLAFTRSELVVSQMDPAVLGAVLDTHVVEGAYARADLTAAGSVTALNGHELPVQEPEGTLIVDYALVANEPLQASNGVLYVIDTLLLAPETGPEKSIWGVLQADGRFSTFLSILEGSIFMTDLRFRDNFDAVLAPTDEAFANMPGAVADYLESHPHDYEIILLYHLLTPDGWPQGVDLTVADMVEMESVQTRIGSFGQGFEALTVVQSDSGVTINDAQIVQGDIDATNGVVHAIDTVLLPPSLLEHIGE